MNNFRLKCKHLFLTYKSHFLINKFKKLKNLSKFNKFTYKYAWETGETGYKHTHILLAFDKAIDTKDCRFFDIPGIKHPNIVKILTQSHWKNTVKYLEKETFACQEDTLTGNEYLWLGSIRNIIQNHKTWNNVLNDDDITMYIQKYYRWAEAVFQAKPKPVYKLAKLRPFQEQLVTRINQLKKEQNDRKVLWICDRKGDSGKTKLCKHLLSDGAFLVTGGKSADNAYRFNYEEVVLFNLTRSLEDFTPYHLIESFKDGILNSPKYMSEMKLWETSQVVVFANFYPDKSKLSEDRWEIYNLEGGKLTLEVSEIVLPPEVLNIKRDFRNEKKISLPDMIRCNSPFNFIDISDSEDSIT